ncbi:hypothetical protein TcWFU_003631 [Taenia crassiceps]|uniref:Uncharacterized protein n=1 Tax=Taenia crassiceps TaxID=6207 RepID=A0ABR4QPZ8_9CEST
MFTSRRADLEAIIADPTAFVTGHVRKPNNHSPSPPHLNVDNHPRGSVESNYVRGDAFNRLPTTRGGSLSTPPLSHLGRVHCRPKPAPAAQKPTDRTSFKARPTACNMKVQHARNAVPGVTNGSNGTPEEPQAITPATGLHRRRTTKADQHRHHHEPAKRPHRLRERNTARATPRNHPRQKHLTHQQS